LKSSLVLLAILCLALSAETASAQAAGGGVDGGGGGGKMVPDQDEGGPGLTTIFNEGIVFLTEGECKLAEKKFKRVLKKVPRNSQANYLRGVSLQCQNKHQQAVRYFKRAKRDDASYFRAYSELGMSYLILERPDLASKQLTQLEEMKSTCGDRCPPLLLKSVIKLRTALARIEGRPVDPDQE
jgi:tetratricopeptide (TPR) repeat protein